ncbi:hypothetical protein HELRODRAFT_182509 [Helobdella robusta]|uniref:Peptidase M15A C-terminal domain-containing protein n=1 Tax=Helobdella robusta TaxID=6412 RepID=T1FIA6_HELRO|nr:hypothetical protein HELRODRAFT_182509 [Helobdella robusta]ESN90918.1 hypothetical protein HELRODRAFT_182509 [Helobdella robusta]
MLFGPLSFLTTLTLCSLAVVSSASNTYTDSEARKILSDNGISVNKPKPATSLDGIRKNTIKQLLTLKVASGCDIVVTAGTESGHSTSGVKNHGTGYKVDIRINTCISNYIEQNFNYIGQRGGDQADMYKSNAGNIYALESNHWDILYV